ncbi:hypothetical protein EVAR_18704_1 [Eumeta japonica]|uniref:Uncharacterized protein n=1 Tax=Eumeta variegata TaxID=151549 RepID=A0A4C1U6R0_EUMVA|nr:hypothetical protein EVAR_18704_1 [Eumeta japonica]
MRGGAAERGHAPVCDLIRAARRRGGGGLLPTCRAVAGRGRARHIILSGGGYRRAHAILAGASARPRYCRGPINNRFWPSLAKECDLNPANNKTLYRV